MNESWWEYHLDRWCHCKDEILQDLARRIKSRKLFKTLRLENASDPLIERTKNNCKRAGFRSKLLRDHC